MDPNQKKRGFGKRVYYQLLIRLYHLFQSWFFLKPLFGPMSYYTSSLRPKDCPHPDYWATVVVRLCWFFSAFSKQFRVVAALAIVTGIYPLLSIIYRFTMNSQIEKYKRSGFDFKKVRGIPLPEWDWNKNTPQEFYQKYWKTRHPVVLRGFMKDSQLLKEFSFDNLLKKYGDEMVLVAYMNEGREGVLGKLSEMAKEGVYLQAVEKIFRKYPEVNAYYQFERFIPYFAGDGAEMRPGYSQMFAGYSVGTGSPLHSAPVWNWFFQIDGTKHWYFVEPYESMWLYPFYKQGAAAAFTCALYPDDYEEETFPACQYAPYFEVHLEPGDVMFVPPWWWHAIRNTSKKSVGVASRWHTNGEIGDNFVFSDEDYNVAPFSTMNFFAGFTSWQFLDQVLTEPSPTFDEHATLREKNTRFIFGQRSIAKKPGLNFFGYRFTF